MVLTQVSTVLSVIKMPAAMNALFMSGSYVAFALCYRCLEASSDFSQITLMVSVPRPATPPTMVSPLTTAATPSGVPV